MIKAYDRRVLIWFKRRNILRWKGRGERGCGHIAMIRKK